MMSSECVGGGCEVRKREAMETSLRWGRWVVRSAKVRFALDFAVRRKLSWVCGGIFFISLF